MNQRAEQLPIFAERRRSAAASRYQVPTRDNARRSLRNPARHWRVSSVMKKGATALPVLLVLTLSVCLVSSSAEARKWRWRHFYGAYDYGYVVPFGDDGWRDRISEGVETARPRI